MLRKKHPTSVSGYKDNKELGKDIAKMRYDKMVEVLIGIAEDIKRQQETDRERGRMKLSNSLNEFHEKLIDAIESGQKVWEICKPFMKDEER
ncbi:MAG: hypothetical protein WC356_05795 [Candidatus Micrarchaeia archaeon]|jgi:hypothetical protein